MIFLIKFDSLYAFSASTTYDKNKRKIVEYYGPSNILNDKGEIQNVYIFYD